jgi:hypothetical protein
VLSATLHTPEYTLTGARNPEGDTDVSLTSHIEKAGREVALVLMCGDRYERFADALVGGLWCMALEMCLWRRAVADDHALVICAPLEIGVVQETEIQGTAGRCPQAGLEGHS